MTQINNYERAVAVTPSDTTILDCAGFFVGVTGNVAIQTTRGTATGNGTVDTSVTLKGCIAGTIYPISCHRIMSANTTATDIVALS